MNLIRSNCSNNFLILLTVFLTIIISNVIAQNDNYYEDLQKDYPGPYCRSRTYNQCCTSRQDSCSIPIETTLCYCDQFCKRGRGGDCCPDYLSTCEGLAPPPNITSCVYKRAYYRYRERFYDNCNKCECLENGRTDCEKNVCIQDEDIIRNINNVRNLGWTAKNYTEFWGRKYSQGLALRLGTFEPRYKVKSMTRLSNRGVVLPRHFNALHEWSSLISEVKDQGWCGSSWVISTTSVASDRFAIQSKGEEAVTLSPQNILSCTRMQRGCDGGHLDAAWRYLNKVGVVSDKCWPYNGTNEGCRAHGRKTLSQMNCHEHRKNDRDHFYKMGPAYSINNESDIMMEIKTSGPVQATMRVHRDFFSYSGGIYMPSGASRNDEQGFHSVRIVGWGEESDYQQEPGPYSYQPVRYWAERSDHETPGPIKYWIAANSWGSWWGENGYFKIKRGVCGIEDYVLASLPHVFNPYIRN